MIWQSQKQAMQQNKFRTVVFKESLFGGNPVPVSNISTSRGSPSRLKGNFGRLISKISVS